MRVLVACEESQVVTDALRSVGAEAYSCDLVPTSGHHPEWHIQDDALAVAYGQEWDMMLAFPPCTYLCATANRWMHPKYQSRWPTRQDDRRKAIDFFLSLYRAPIRKVAVENPVGVMSSQFRQPDQYVEPYYFGDAETKRTGLWLRGLPCLTPTGIVEPRVVHHKNGKTDAAWHYETKNLEPAERSKARSKTFPGLAKAMAAQWGTQLDWVGEQLELWEALAC